MKDLLDISLEGIALSEAAQKAVTDAAVETIKDGAARTVRAAADVSLTITRRDKTSQRKPVVCIAARAAASGR